MERDYMSELRAVDLDIDTLKKRRDKVKREFAEAKGPFNLGDIIPVQGDSYIGKDMEVTAITINRHYGYQYRWLIYGLVLNKDGSTGFRSTNFTTPI